MKPNPTGVQPVTSRSITRFSAFFVTVPLEEQNHPVTARAGAVPLPSAAPADGHIRRKIDTRYERITQSLQSIGYAVQLGTVAGRLCIRTITRSEAVKNAA